MTLRSVHRTRDLHLSAKSDYDTVYGLWDTDKGPVPVASQFRIAWRRMAATTGFRTFYPAIIPPGSVHVHPVNSAAHVSDNRESIRFGAVASSMLTDFRVRSGGTSEIQASQVLQLPMPKRCDQDDRLIRTFLRLNCLTSAYAPLWESITGEPWTLEVPIRIAWNRQQAQIEIDALVALSLGVSAEELCMIYRTQFPVMRRYDLEQFFDANGRIVPKEILAKWRKSDSERSSGDFEWTHPQSSQSYNFELPFHQLDREAALRSSYDRYSREAL